MPKIIYKYYLSYKKVEKKGKREAALRNITEMKMPDTKLCVLNDSN